MRCRVVAVRHRGQKWQSKWHYSRDSAVKQAVRWREQHDLLALGIEDETGREHPMPTDAGGPSD